MVIREDGSFVGSVGGGRLEADCIAEAPRILAEDRPKVLAFHMTGTEVAETAMICGGDVEIFIEPLTPKFTDIYANIIEIQKRGGKAALATAISSESVRKGTRRKALVIAEGKSIGPLALDGETLAAAQEVIHEQTARLIPREGGRIYLEPIFPEPMLYLFGAGHISRFIAPVAHMVGFRVIVIDDREEFANREYFPLAEEIRVEEFARAGKKIDLDEQAYIVIVTRGHMHDYTILQQVLPMDCRYIGMIGSKRKREMIFKKLLQEGHAQRELDRVHAPIGLDIGAEAPEEIAVSIVAELISVRAEERPVQEKKWTV
jgi:xanthine dehydrogenase accessory factor